MSIGIKSIKLFLLFSFLSTLMLTGCGQHKETDSELISHGVRSLLSVTQKLNIDLGSHDDEKIKLDGLDLEEAWGPFEDNVKSLYPEFYAKVEDSLDPIIAGTKSYVSSTNIKSTNIENTNVVSTGVVSTDEKIFIKLNNQLIQTLNDLAKKNSANL